MTNPYKQLREALESGPTDGPWAVWNDQVLGADECPIAEVNTCGFQDALPYNSIDATYIAAANPQAIAALLAERDALREALKGTIVYVECAYECAFPDEIQNEEVLSAALAALGEKP